MNDDFSRILKVDFIDWNFYKGKTFFVTGATGLIGTTFIKALELINKEKELNLHVIALVRNEEKAKKRFCEIADGKFLSFYVGNVENTISLSANIDYIVHGASMTASRDFINTPVETINTSVSGTYNMLELAKEKKVKRFIYLSSMEVYGYQKCGHKVIENEIGKFASNDLRNCYPISKIAAESLCYSFAKEYGVSCSICRLAQTYGGEYSKKDNRLFAYFKQCIDEKKDIVLNTYGESERCYIHSLDVVTAILTIICSGSVDGIYNVADEESYCSVASMAERIAKSGNIHVRYDIQDKNKNGFPETTYLDLDTTALKKLGWKVLEG